MHNTRLNTTLKPSNIKNRHDLNRQTQDMPQVLAGKKVYPGTQRYEVQAALEASYRAGTLRKVASDSSNLINDLSVMLIYGAEISPEPINYSLLTRQTDTEEIDNENIMPNYDNVQNQNIDTSKSFKNIKDSFYTLDNARPRKMQASIDACIPTSLEKLNRASVTNVASYFAGKRKNTHKDL